MMRIRSMEREHEKEKEKPEQNVKELEDEDEDVGQIDNIRIKGGGKNRGGAEGRGIICKL